MPENIPKLIAIVGAECTGKTTLAKALATRFKSPWVPEYLRDFCDAQQRTPRQDEQQNIMDAQVALEERLQKFAFVNHAPFVFCDTAPLLTAVYSDYIFADTSLYAKAQALHARYALTLLLLHDIDWVADGLQREGCHVQNPVHTLIARALNTINAPIITVSGSGNLRTICAINAVFSLA